MAEVWNKNGTSAADTIYVTEPEVKVIGGYGNDTYIVKGNAVKNTIGNRNTEYGNDTLKILAGDYITFYNLNGSNTIEISNGSYHEIYTGDKKDILTLKSGVDSVKAELAAGANEVIINAGTQHNISAGSGSDVLTVGYMESSTIALGNGENTVKLNGGFGNTIKLGNDKDTVTINKGYNNTIRAYDGDDVIYINKDAGSNVFYSGKGNDRFTVNSVSKQEIHVNEANNGDKNVILLKAGDGHHIEGSAGNSNARIELYVENANNVTGNLGDSTDKAVIETGTGNSINLANNDDMGSIRGGTGNVITGGWGNDTLSIEGNAGANNSLYGNGGDDNLYVNAGISGIQNLDGGSNDNRDSFNVNSEKAIVRITANGTKASIVLNKGNAVDETGAGHTVTSNANNNYLYIGKDANTVANNVQAQINGKLNNSVVYGSDNSIISNNSSDSVYIRSGERNYVSTGYGNDYIYIDGGNNHTIRGGFGERDNIYVRMSLGSNARLTLDQGGSNDLRDILHLSNEYKKNFSYSYNKSHDSLLIKKNNGALITVQNWTNNRLQVIEFKDGTYSNWSSVATSANLTSAKNEIAADLMVFKADDSGLGEQTGNGSVLTETSDKTIFITGSANV